MDKKTITGARMNNKGLVSVIIPVYNAEKTIDTCLNSILQQDYKNIEIIIINDGSSDNSVKICNDYKKRDDRITIINQLNSGPAVARNKGLDNATGEYIMFVDSDDWIDVECISSAVLKAIQNDADIVLWNAVIEYSQKRIKNTPLKGDERIFESNDFDYLNSLILSYSSENNNMSNISLTGPVCKLFKKKIINEHRFPEELFLGEDLCFLYSVIPHVNRIDYICKYYYHINRVGESLSKTFNSNYSKWKVDFVNYITKIFDGNDFYNEILDKFIFHNLLTVMEHSFFYSSNLSYRLKVKHVMYFTTNTSRKINYTNIHHKCAFFCRIKWYFPVYLIGKLSPKYK